MALSIDPSNDRDQFLVGVKYFLDRHDREHSSMAAKPGDRVVAIVGRATVSGRRVLLHLGYGTYDGPRPIPWRPDRDLRRDILAMGLEPDHETLEAYARLNEVTRCNPHITLDNGDECWGLEVWWAALEELPMATMLLLSGDADIPPMKVRFTRNSDGKACEIIGEDGVAIFSVKDEFCREVRRKPDIGN